MNITLCDVCKCRAVLPERLTALEIAQRFVPFVIVTETKTLVECKEGTPSPLSFNVHICEECEGAILKCVNSLTQDIVEELVPPIRLEGYKCLVKEIEV